MTYFEYYNLILYFKQSQVKSKYKTLFHESQVNSSVFGLVFGSNTFDLLNIFSINFVIEGVMV